MDLPKIAYQMIGKRITPTGHRILVVNKTPDGYSIVFDTGPNILVDDLRSFCNVHQIEIKEQPEKGIGA